MMTHPNFTCSSLLVCVVNDLKAYGRGDFCLEHDFHQRISKGSSQRHRHRCTRSGDPTDVLVAQYLEITCGHLELLE